MNRISNDWYFARKKMHVLIGNNFFVLKKNSPVLFIEEEYDDNPNSSALFLTQFGPAMISWFWVEHEIQ